MPRPYGITPTGFSRPTSEEILSDLDARQKELISPLWKGRGGTSVAGVVNSEVASHASALWDALEQVFRQFDPRDSEGEALESVSAITGTLRLPARKTVIPGVNLTLPAGASFSAGALIAALDTDATAQAKNSFQIAVPGSGGSPTIVFAQFEALNTGPLLFPQNHLTVRAVPVAGWTGVTNPDACVLGADVESEESLRLRRESELASGGSATVPGIVAALSGLGLASSSLLSNDGDVADVYGVGPHTVEAIVEGGVDADIAKVIFEHKAPGDGTQGGVSVQVTAADGVRHAVNFTRPANVDMYLILRVQVTSEFPGATALANDVVAFAETRFKPGMDVVSSVLEARCFQTAGVWNAVAALVGSAPAPTLDGVYDIGPRQRARFAFARTTVEVVP